MNDPDPALTVSRCFADATRGHLERLREGERLVREEGNLEGVHLMRTSCRRLRATLKVLGDPLPRETRKSLQISLRETMADLSPVRDLDVLRRSIGSMPELGAPEAEELKGSLEGRLSEAAARMKARLDGPGYAAMVGTLSAAAALPGDGTPVARVGPERIGAVVAEALRLKPSDWKTASEEALHGLRKGVKKVRYALEVFVPAYGRAVEKAIARCRDLQESLGLIQDASAFGELLKGIRTFSAGQFIATVRARASGEAARLPGLWEKAFGRKAAARLGAHLFRRAALSGVPSPAPERLRETA
jgi:CHAD domain-containing protein